MKRVIILATMAIFGGLLSACSGISQQLVNKNANQIAPYPSAEAGYTRSVIYLPELKDEDNAKIDLLIGKDMLVDCNVHRLSGSVKKEDLKGWGYDYYVVSKTDNTISTLMACPADDNKKIEFVTMNHDLGLIRYNSKLPIVVYAPSDVNVKYQVWSTEGNRELATKE